MGNHRAKLTENRVAKYRESRRRTVPAKAPASTRASAAQAAWANARRWQRTPAPSRAAPKWPRRR